MVKMLEVIGRRRDLTHEAFLKHLSKTHLEVVERVPEFLNRVRGYVQSHVFVEPAETSTVKGLPIRTDMDTIIDVWFDSVDAIKQGFQEPRYFEIIRPDEHAFGDVEGAWGVLTDEVPITAKAGFNGRIKLFVFLKRKAGLTHGEFLTQWQKARDAKLSTAKAFPHVGRWVENRTRQAPADQLPGMNQYDLVTEMWFESLPALSELASDAGVIALFTQSDFLEPGSTRAYIAEEKPESAEWLRRYQARAS